MSEIEESLKSAVTRGDLCRVNWCIDQFDRSYWEAWLDGYELLIDAIESSKSREIAILLLKAGFRVNGDIGLRKSTPLISAIEKNDPEIVDMLLDRCVDPNHPTDSYYPPLLKAVSKGNARIVNSLLKKKAQVNVSSKFGITPLHTAVSTGNIQIVECLLNHGACVNIACSRIWRPTPLRLAVQMDNEKLVELLLSRGADINTGAPNKSTSLHIAAGIWRSKSLKVLLEHGGGDIDALDENGQTILQVAIQRSNVTTVENIMELCPEVINHVRNRKYLIAALNSRDYNICEKVIEGLLKYGFTVNSEDANDGELLHAAVRKGHLKLIEQLLECGADVNAPDENGRTLLHETADHDQIEAAKLLIKYGADVNAVYEDKYYPISRRGDERGDVIHMTTLLVSSGAKIKNFYDMLHIAIEKKCHGIVEFILRDSDLAVNASYEFGRPALHYAVFVNPREISWRKNILDIHYAARDIAEAILNRGADVNAPSKGGITALHIAVYCEIAPCVEILLKHGANVNSVNYHEATPLHFSAAIRNGEICKMLLDNGARVNAKDIQGNTPLHVACQKSNGEVVATLMEYGAEIDSWNNENASPLQYAVDFGTLNVVKQIMKLLPDVEWRDKFGRTALIVASKFAKAEVFEELLEYYGCNFDVTRYNGLTVLQYVSRIKRVFIYGIDDALPRVGTHESPDYHLLPCNDYEYNFYYNHSRIDVSQYENRGQDGYSQLSRDEILKRHIVKIKALNLYVSQQNLDSVDIKGDYESFYIDCKIEAEMLKNEKINDTNVSFHDILTKGVSRLTLYARNEHIADVLESACYKDKFPIYANMMYHNFKKGQIRESLLIPGTKSLNFLSGFALPEITSAKLLSHLSDKDVRSLIKAAGPDIISGKTVISVG